MPDSDAQADDDSAGQQAPLVADAVQTTEFYETDEGVVFYDAENPLAWIQAEEILSLDDVA